MEKLLKYFLSAIILIILLGSCGNSYDYYVREFTEEENTSLASQMEEAAYEYYQGSPGNMVLLENARTLDPTKAKYYREIGVPYLKRGFPVEFAQYYAKSADIDPSNWQGWRGYLYLYFYRDYEKALADFDATDQLTPDFVDYPQSISVDYMRAICYLYLNQPRKTIAYLDKHIALEDSTVGRDYIDSKSFLMRGKAYQELGEYESAWEDYQEALRIDPEIAGIYYNIAKLQSEKGEITNARENLKKAQASYNRGIIYRRNYVDEFFTLYQTDIDELYNSLNNRE